MIEANPRASRTVPFVSKAIGAPIAKIACRLMLGEPLADQDVPPMPAGHVSVKEAVLPFSRFSGADTVLGPEMKSTGEVMGVAGDFPTAFGKAQAAAGVRLPSSGTVFITVTDADKAAATQLATRFCDLGFRIIATGGTAQAISRMGVPVEKIHKIQEGSPNVVDYIERGEVDMVINTPTGSGARSDGYEIRSAATRRGIPCITTMTGASAAARAIGAQRRTAPTRCAACRSCTRAATRGRRRRGRERAGRAGRAGPSAGDRVARARSAGGAREVVANEATGGYRLITRRRPRGADAAGGAVLHAHRRARLGRGGARPYLPRAFSVADATADDRGVRLSFLLEDVGPGTARARRASSRATGCCSPGPLGRPFSLPDASSTPTPPGRSSSAAASASRRWRSGAASSPRGRSRSARCSASATRRHCGGLELFRCSEVRLASEDGHAGHRGYVTDLLAVMLEGDAARERRRLRLRAAGDARGGAGALRRARGRGGAGDGVADGLRLRRLLRLRDAAARRRLHAALRRRPGGPRRRGRDGAGRGGRAPMSDRAASTSAGSSSPTRSSTRSGTFDAIAARRAFGDAVLERFPFSAYVSKTITPAPRAGNPPPRLWEEPAAMVNSIGLPNKGLDGFLAPTCRSSPSSPVPLIVSVMATSAEEFTAMVEAVAERDEVAAIELNVSCPNVHSGLIVGEQPAESRGADGGAAAADRQAADREADAERRRPGRDRASPPPRAAPTRSR